MAQTAMVVETDARRRDEMSRLAERAGFQVEKLDDGRRAIERLRTHAPDLLITELALPRVDGFALVRALREAAPKASVIVVSAFRELRDAAVRLRGELGIDALLPANAPLSSLERAIARARPGGPPQPPLAPVAEAAPPPEHEQERIRKLRATGLVGGDPDPRLQQIVAEVAARFGVPMALISFVLEDRQWFKAYAGIGGTLLSERGSSRDLSFCRHVVDASKPMVVPDATSNPAFAANPLVTGGIVRGYAGVPLVSAAGAVLGTLCILDSAPLKVGPSEVDELQLIARRVAGELELMSQAETREAERERLQRLVSRESDRARALGEELALLAAVVDAAPVGMLLMDAGRHICFVNRAFEQLLVPGAALLGKEREAWVEAVAGLTADPGAFRARVQVDAEGPYLASATFEVERPLRRALRWSATPLLLPGGPGQLATFEDVTAEVELARERERLALTDALTGLANRRGGEEALRRDAARGLREQSPLGLVLFDIDHFKRVNDGHGHAAGDAALARVARTLAGQARPYDTIVRWGGEELLAILPGVGLEGARAFAERSRQAVEALMDEPRVTLSAGVAICEPGANLDEALARADQTLYRAKDGGRNRVEA